MPGSAPASAFTSPAFSQALSLVFPGKGLGAEAWLWVAFVATQAIRFYASYLPLLIRQ